MENKENIDNFWQSINVEPGNNEVTNQGNKENVDDFWKSVEEKPVIKGPSDRRNKIAGVILTILIVVFAYVDGTFEKLNIFVNKSDYSINSEYTTMLNEMNEGKHKSALEHGYKAEEYTIKTDKVNTISHAGILFFISRLELQLGLIKEAEQNCKRLLVMIETIPDTQEMDFLTRYYLVLLYKKGNRSEEAIELLENLYSLIPHIKGRHAEKLLILLHRSSYALDNGKTEKFEKTYNEFNELITKYPEIKKSIEPVYKPFLEKIKGLK